MSISIQDIVRLGTVLFGIVPDRLTSEISELIDTQSDLANERYRVGLRAIIVRCLKEELETLTG
jgi:hypothetical protein